ncbi:CbtA family protein [Chthonobacter albigriseus]|uniref:CbtA family protein n=1 Tax=Chthonobacter albigriseus TaxID=1683161 RepID=UPI0015EF155B|nr:CbtA family protein [Chthonobacter albigriseus]
MLKRVLLVGLLAGLAAGLAMAVLQHFTTVPLIMAAEAYEAAPAGVATEPAPAATGHDHGAMGHEHGGSAWMPADGLERTLSTTVATVVSVMGFALVLIAVLLLAGEEITPTRALAYAAAGFASTGLATALGLAPELPGSAAADLVDRQLWWGATVLATALALYLLIRAKPFWAKPVGVLLLVAPHVVGAPHPDGYASVAPAELAAHFASASLAVHAVMWALVGASVGFFWQRVRA